MDEKIELLKKLIANLKNRFYKIDDHMFVEHKDKEETPHYIDLMNMGLRRAIQDLQAHLTMMEIRIL